MKFLLAIIASFFGGSLSAQYWSPNGTNIYNSNSGYVGIGTDAPQNPLQIEGAVPEVNLMVQNRSTPAGARTYLSAFVNKSSIQTDKDFTIMTNGGGWSDKFILTNAGNVGIGTDYPTAKLEVKGALKLNDGTAAHKGLINFGIDDIIFENSPEGDNYTELQIKNWNGSGYNNALRIKLNGDIAIGTTKADAKLTVDGDIHAKEVRVDLNFPAPDYVFEQNYNLRTLEEVHRYINENKHLPEVPSAKEMEQNGVNLSEMNMLLLKKVEELTLYVIELKKEIDEVKKVDVNDNVK